MTQIETYKTLLMLSFSVCVGARHLGVLALDTVLPLAVWLGTFTLSPPPCPHSRPSRVGQTDGRVRLDGLVE